LLETFGKGFVCPRRIRAFMLKTAPFLFVLLFTRCISYVPLSYHGSGSSLTAKIEAKEATMYLQHINHQYQHLVFDFEVNNQSSDTVALAPEQISYYFSATRFSKKEFNQLEDGVSTLRLNKSRFARSTTEVHELFQRKEKSRANVGAIFTLISVGLIIYDETKDNSDSRKRYLSEKDVRQAATRDAIVTAGLLAADIANKSTEQAQTESYYLPFEIFREGKIEPNAKRRGKIFLPAEETLTYLRIIVPFANKQFVFDFKQKGS
jgi:hypothetical protein